MIDLYLTDPPYNVAISNSQGMTIKNDDMENEQFKDFLVKSFKNAYDYMKGGASFYIWFADVETLNFTTAVKEVDLKLSQMIIWKKNSLVLGRKDYQFIHEPCLYGWKEGSKHNWYNDRSQTTILDFDKPTKNDLHPTMKPLELMGYLITNSSKKGDKVLDTFGGSGSTLIACEQLERKCYTMELDEKYASVILSRWEKLTGNKAVLVS